MKLGIVPIIIILGLVFVSGITGYVVLTKPIRQQAIITRIIDGDTVDISTGERVRLLGINTPETNEAHYQDAKDRLTYFVFNKTVELESGPQDTDLYGRLLRYIFVNDTFVNLEMVKGGYASVFLLTPDEKYYLEFKSAEKQAKNSNLGIWNTSAFGVCINITEFHYTGDEYVKFHNNCNYSIQMDGWEIKDEGTHIYTFKAFSLKSNSDFTLFTTSGSNTADQLYWNSKTTIWNNDGDTLFLHDNKGNLVLTYSYP